MQDGCGVHGALRLRGRAPGQLVPLLCRRHVLHDQGEAVRVRVVIVAVENVGVPANELVGDGARDVVEVEGAFLFGHARVEDHLQQEIAQFLAKCVAVAALDGVGYLVGFLNGVGRNRAEILLDVPRAALGRMAQLRHDRDQTVDVGTHFGKSRSF